jgi:hypothetical protein
MLRSKMKQVIRHRKQERNIIRAHLISLCVLPKMETLIRYVCFYFQANRVIKKQEKIPCREGYLELCLLNVFRLTPPSLLEYYT